jgi:predicted deacetylase
MHRHFSRGCAEFAHLERAEAARRLAEGRRILEGIGLQAQGFVAPAWQQSAAALDAVQEAGFAFTAFLDHVLLLNGGRSRVSGPALTYDTPHAAIDLGKRAVMRCWAHLQRDAPLLRVALHPDDVLAPGRLCHVLRRIEALGRVRRLVCYEEWMS